MDYLLNLLTSFIDDPQMAQVMVYFVAGAAGITLAIAISLLFSGVYSPIKMQLQKLQFADGQPQARARDNLANTLEHTIDKATFLKRSFTGDNKTKRLLIHAGFQHESALHIYNALKLMLLLIGASLSAFVVRLFPDLSTLVTIYLIALVLGGMYVLPGLILTYIAKRRMRSLRKFFPDALDLLVVCCESGLGLLESFQRVSKEMEYAEPNLSHELALVCSKVRIGFSMQEALHEFSERTGLEDIRGLNSVIVQSLKLGTGIADTLRVYSEEYRDKRLQEAEEQAAKVGVKMIFPMMCCIWPSFFIVAIGPAVLKVMAVWDQAF